MFNFPTIVKLAQKVPMKTKDFMLKVPSSLIDDPNDLYVNWLLTHLARDLELVTWN